VDARVSPKLCGRTVGSGEDEDDEEGAAAGAAGLAQPPT
jgi:hypothetical protein